MEEDSRHMSLKVLDIMSHLGVNEHMRRLYRDYSILHEILTTMLAHILGLEGSVYRFGSMCEGTTSLGMESDHDLVYCGESDPVIQDIQQAPAGKSLLMVADRHTKPGYVKLQLVNDGLPLTIHNCKIIDHSFATPDCMGRVCKRYTSVFGIDKHATERNGPADTLPNVPGCTPMDQVFAYRSRTFPSDALESLLDCTRTGWMTPDEFEKMVSAGCLLVGVGHPASSEKDIEWRISFSLQERQLMFKLNQVQQVCFVLLKHFKHLITSKPELSCSITSYHMKTCLFSVLTKVRPDLWTPENLIDCTLICLRELRECVSNRNLPNFFIKRNNMFEQRLNGPVRERLLAYVQEILDENYRIFYLFQSDIDLLSGKNPSLNVRVTWDRGMMIQNVCMNSCSCLVHKLLAICQHLTTLSNKDAELFLCQQLNYLASVNTVTEHSQEETKATVQALKPILHQLYAQHLASLAFSTDIPAVHDSKHLLQDSLRHLRDGMNWNLMSGRLALATVLYRQGNIEMCRDLLERLDQSLCDEVESVCGCYPFKRYANWKLVEHLLSEHTDSQTVRESYMAVCTIFLPAHIEIVPLALKFEFYRSVGTPPRPRDNRSDNWFDWAVVDSKVYLHFMQYLVYSQLNRQRAKQIATENLWTVLQKECNLGHRETGYNLLGWIYCQEGHTLAAAYCFLQSWNIRPLHNAATLHMLCLVCQQIDQQI